MVFDRLNRASPSENSRSPNRTVWIFDVDGCLIDSLTGSSLRPGARALLERLARDRHRVLLWSAGGDDYARERAAQFGIDGLVSGYFAKEGRTSGGTYTTSHLGVDLRRAVFVDDQPGDLGDDVRVVAVSPYLAPDPHDRALVRIATSESVTGPGRVAPGADCAEVG